MFLDDAKDIVKETTEVVAEFDELRIQIPKQSKDPSRIYNFNIVTD